MKWGSDTALRGFGYPMTPESAVEPVTAHIYGYRLHGVFIWTGRDVGDIGERVRTLEHSTRKRHGLGHGD